MAARLESVDEADVVVDRGEVRIGERTLPIRDVLTRGLGRLGGEVIGIGETRKEADPDHPLGGTAAFYEFNAPRSRSRSIARPATSSIARYVTVSDVGKALNPAQVRGQDEGAAVMGLGHTLMEHYICDDAGRIRNLGAIDYRIPTSMDLPLEMESDIVENEDGPGPYGAKGMSEGALLPVAPAVAAAVRDATGVVIRDLPLTPGAGLAGAPGRGAVVTRSTYRARRAGRRVARRGAGAGRRQGGQPRRDGARPRAAGAARLRDHDRDVPGLPGGRLAGRPRRRAPRPAWPRSRRRSGGGSATPRTRCS